MPDETNKAFEGGNRQGTTQFVSRDAVDRRYQECLAELELRIVPLRLSWAIADADDPGLPSLEAEIRKHEQALQRLYRDYMRWSNL